MDQELIQRSRYLLHSRFRRVQSCPEAMFCIMSHHLVRWLEQHPVLGGHLTVMRGRPSEAVARVRQTVRDLRDPPSGGYEPGFYTAADSEEHAAVCLAIVEGCASFHDVANAYRRDVLVSTLGEYLNGNAYTKPDEALQVVRDLAVDGLFEYLDEQFDSRNAVLGLLRKYKQRTEWFRRHELRRVVLDGGATGLKGERALARHLYEYLADQSVEFFIEPTSSSGEADLVLRDGDGRHVIADAKFIDSGDGRAAILRKLAGGAHQVARYCEDFNEPSGYLVCFSDTPRQICLPVSESDGWPYLQVGSKTVYLLIVSIADLPSASRAGRAEEFVFNEEELKRCLDGQSDE